MGVFSLGVAVIFIAYLLIWVMQIQIIIPILGISIPFLSTLVSVVIDDRTLAWGIALIINGLFIVLPLILSLAPQEDQLRAKRKAAKITGKRASSRRSSKKSKT